MSDKRNGIDRRGFMKSMAVGAGAAAYGLNAATRARAQGANDRLSVAVIGCGVRGKGAHMPGLQRFADSHNVEITAVCDPWRAHREEAAALAEDWFGKAPRQCVSHREVLELDNIDAVMIASCDHQHGIHMKDFAEAGKDIYVEKPITMTLEELNIAYDAVMEHNVVVQVGTQLRSMSSMAGARKVYQEGTLGTVGRVEQHRNAWRPYWYQYMEPELTEDDVDWAEFCMPHAVKPFDPVFCSGWYGYREFSDGPLPGLGAHFIDLVHYITGAKVPESVVAHGGTYTWDDEHKFTCPDHIEALWTYPEGFMMNYCTNFGNGSGNTFRFYGDKGELDLVDWSRPMLTAHGAQGQEPAVEEPTPVEPVEQPDHIQNWVECIRERSKPNADIDAGYAHGVACIMAMRAFDEGKRMVFDPERREIHPG